MQVWGFLRNRTWACPYVVWVLVHFGLGETTPCSTPCGASSFHDVSGDYRFEGTNFSTLLPVQCAVCAWRGKNGCQYPAQKIASRGRGRLLCCAVLEGFCEEYPALEEQVQLPQGESGFANWVISGSFWVSEKIISLVVDGSEFMIKYVAQSHEAVEWCASAAADFVWPQSDLLAFHWALLDVKTWAGITILTLIFYKSFRTQVRSALQAYQEEDPLIVLEQWERWCERSQLRDEEYWPLVMVPGAIRRFDADQSKGSSLTLDGVFQKVSSVKTSLVATGSRVKNRVRNLRKKPSQDGSTSASETENEENEGSPNDRPVSPTHTPMMATIREPPATPHPTSSSSKRIISSPQRMSFRRDPTGGRRKIRFEICPDVLGSDATPVLCFCNPASGGKQGDHVLTTLSQLLNPMQVYNLRKCQPVEILQWFLDGFGSRLRILVAGGDGTVGWIFSIFDELAAKNLLQCRPSVAILPLGTGNDMARVMGWGGGYSGGSLKAILAAITRHASPTYLDRWEADLTLPTSVARHPVFFHLKGKSRVNFTNYFGVGVDAEVVNNFHELRNHRPQLFWSRWVNRFHYTWMGVLSSARRSCVHLHRHVTVTCDGKPYELDPDVEGVIVSNIASYAGGVTLWCSEPDVPKASQQDGMLDVVLVKGSDHLGWIQLGLDKAIKLCQARTVEIVSRAPLPMHADGEPWVQPPSRLVITAKECQEVLLKKNVSDGEAVFVRTLDWAVSESVITAEQKQVLVQELSRRTEAKVVSRDPKKFARFPRVLSGTFANLFGSSSSLSSLE